MASTPFCHVKTSGIHGKGLFAARAIPADTLIIAIEGKPTTRDGTYVIWSDDDDGELQGLRITNDARFANHSAKPNAAFYGDELWSLRAIRRGEELTHHYGSDWDDL
jgi:SET domain-containing protein